MGRLAGGGKIADFVEYGSNAPVGSTQSPQVTVRKHDDASASQGGGRIHSAREHKSDGDPARLVSWGE